MADKKISALPAATTPLAGTEVLPIVQGGVTDKVSVANLTVGRDVSAKTLTGESNGVGAPSEVIARNTAGGERIHLISRNAAGISFAQSQNSQLHIGSYDNFAVQILVNNASKMLFDTNSDVKVQTGNLVIGTAGKGIDFSANGGDVLSQYDEGTWTTTVDGVVNFTGTPTLSSAKYTRIGRQVTLEGKFAGTVTTGSTNAYFQFTLPILRSSGTDGGAGSVFSNSGLKLGGIYNASASTTTAYLVMPSSSDQPSGADVFFFSYTYNV